MRTLLLPLITALIAAAALLGGCQNNQEPGTATLPDACSQPPESGMCKAFQRYYYDADTGSCQAFIWGGCKGSVPFETMEACTQACNATGSPAPAKGAPVSTSATNKEAQQ